MTPLSRACVSPYSILLKLRLYLVSFLRYSASSNGVTLKSGLGVDLLKMVPLESSGTV